MRVLTGLNAVRRAPLRAVVTVGMFDGVHIAHQQLIRTTVRLARRSRGTSIVITFDPDPQLVLDPRHAPSPIMPLERRLQLIAALGADLVWVIPFTKTFATLTPEDFVRRILEERLRATCIVVGETFGFGRARQGNLELLRTLGQQSRMRVVALTAVTRRGQVVSSSRIRRLIQTGDLAQARQLLSRPFELTGKVVHGSGRGHQLGFPTANVRLVPTLMPPRGVYTVWLHHAARRWNGLMNLGTRPTFGKGPLVCEVYLPRFRGQLYGRLVTIGLLTRLRGEHRFRTPQALVRQIQRDLLHARLVS